MFANFSTQHPLRRNKAISRNTSSQHAHTYLRIAVTVALGCMAAQAQAADNRQTYNELPAPEAAFEYENSDSVQSTSKSQMPARTTVQNVTVVDKDLVAQRAKFFSECTQVQSSAARLACFDKVAEQGEVPSYTSAKQPVDLAKTFKTTISGNPQVVFVGDSSANALKGSDTTESLVVSQSTTTDNVNASTQSRPDEQILEDVGVTQADVEKYTPLSLAYDLDQNSERGIWTVRPYRPTYLLPLFYTFDPNLSPSTPSQDVEPFDSNDIRETELKFQLSLKSKVAEDLFDTSADLWFGYTQESHWQVYNEDNSRPFRATDYQPEIFLTQPVTANLPFGGRLRMLGAGAVHHSNGQDDPLSRSWNRAYLMAGAEWGKLSVIPRVWARVNNEDESSEDNPDIEDYMGYGDIKFLYDLPKEQSLSGTLRYNPSTNKGAAQIDYIYPLSENVNGMVQLFQGYGESIIDYNHENTSIGFGIVLNDWKGL